MIRKNIFLTKKAKGSYTLCLSELLIIVHY